MNFRLEWPFEKKAFYSENRVLYNEGIGFFRENGTFSVKKRLF